MLFASGPGHMLAVPVIFLPAAAPPFVGEPDHIDAITAVLDAEVHPAMVAST